ncbi:rna-directed dna polymerase from mobile element jockey-like [Limosa lapponica baueri]|uniref:Rna-directed dna polymerase from mobile element jockey-like n=1 Tax=Limosa lapponica baueri TaxID=1758121 RepID=A0A2I0U738_LIMLA|nr:rna-directed dna polymerase from mobile element jockey-like [Limosa lapponica baueri]
MGPDGIHPRVLRELAEVFAEPLSIISQQSWQTGEVPANWRLANVTPIQRKGWQDDLGNYRPVSLTSVPGKVMGQIILSAIMQRMKEAQVIGPSQHGFMRGRSCLTNLISFYGKVTRLVDEGKAVDVVYLDFSKAFDTVSHSYTDELIEEVVKLYSTQSLNDTVEERVEQDFRICLQHISFQTKRVFWKAICHT